ncbi:MAG: carbamoyl-phosphate synthase small chain [Candidatus Tectimicrobiota bacterium]|nr:MAG: carbamoyl-phosphate synthase small chain [Candidatus Tectomicrobia bacterium]
MIGVFDSDIAQGLLVLEDGTTFAGVPFGAPTSAAGEVVFNTGMVGYPEALTDPSYRGQILVLTYPLIGNYGVPPAPAPEQLAAGFESNRIQVQGLVVADASPHYSHWQAARSLDAWLRAEGIPALSGVDTRRLTKHLRKHGTMLGKLILDGHEPPWWDPNRENLVAQVSVKQPVAYGRGRPRLVVVDCGCKHSILRCLLQAGASVLRVPWDYDFLAEDFDGVVISNGPGDPTQCQATIAHVRRAMAQDVPLLGICLGHQILALAAGARTYKLKFGHRSQNQPCLEAGGQRCYITAQNHGYAVAAETLPPEWVPWFVNANDGTNEGLRHRSRPFLSVQFHPEAAPGPLDTAFLFETFLRLCRR